MKLTRRELLKWGVVGATSLAAPLGTLQIPLTQIAQLESQASPVTRPFQVPLPIPPILKPVRQDDKADYYEITQKAATAQILPGLTTPIWGYNGIFPGPTIEARTGRQIVIRQFNELPVPVVTHLHGGVTAPESDGYPMDLIMPKGQTNATAHDTMSGQMNMAKMLHPGGSSDTAFKDYIYPNHQVAATHWYHDHRMDFTGPQVYKGLAGFYLIRDEEENRLPLPKGEREVPLMILDRTFNADGSFFYPALDPTYTKNAGVIGKYASGMLGDTILVNGAVQPYFEVSNTKYRFRILNASNARLYQLALSSGQPFVQIGSDSGLLPAPASLPTIQIAPAERFDVVIDFSLYPVGTQVILKNLLGSGRTAEIMRFDVVRQASEESTIPATLTHFEKLDPATAVANRKFQFFYGLAMWTINGQYFDTNRIDATPRLGSTEIWEFSSDGDHPIHLHLVKFQVLSRNGRPPNPEDAGWKDTVMLRKSEKAQVIAKFEGYRGLYVFHCHNLEHEDMRMMGQFEVI